MEERFVVQKRLNNEWSDKSIPHIFLSAAKSDKWYMVLIVGGTYRIVKRVNNDPDTDEVIL